MKRGLRDNRTPGAILLNMLIAAVSLFVNGFGVYLTIQANIGAGPVSVGTLICAFGTKPIMQLAFTTVRFDATGNRHQRLKDSMNVMMTGWSIRSE